MHSTWVNLHYQPSVCSTGEYCKCLLRQILSLADPPCFPEERPWAPTKDLSVSPLCQDLGRPSLSLNNYPWQAKRATQIRSQACTHITPTWILYANLTLTQQAANPSLIRALLEGPWSIGSARASSKLALEKKWKKRWSLFEHLFLSSVIDPD